MSGLLALLDDVVALAKIAATTLDDATAQAGKAGAKAAGIVIDDAAVTPRYVTGLAAKRELPIIGRIALDQGDSAKAIENLKTAVGIDRSDADSIQMLGSAYVANGQYDPTPSLLRPSL